MVRAYKRFILFFSLFILGYASVFSVNKNRNEKHIYHIELIIDNNLLYSPSFKPNDFIQNEAYYVTIFKQRRDYKRMFLIKQMAVYILGAQGHITEALSKAKKMLEEARQMYYETGIGIAYLAIGDTYLNADMNKEASEKYKEALEYLDKTPNSGNLQERVLIQLVPILTKLKRMKEAEEHINNISRTYEKARYNHFIINIFKAYYNLQNDSLKQALYYIKKAEKWHQRHPLAYYGSLLKYVQAEYAQKTGDYKGSIKLYRELADKSKAHNAHNRYLKLETTLAGLYTQQGDLTKACETYQTINSIRDSIKARNYSSQINLLRTIYQMDHLEIKNQNQRGHLLFYLIVGSIFILVIFIVALFHTYYTNKKLTQSKKKLEEARRKMENSIQTKSLFISNMSHEIRTPLNALSGFSSILIDENINDEIRQQCNEIILQNSDLLLKLIDDVVDLSSLDTGKMNFHFEKCDAVSICWNIIDTINKIKQTAATVEFKTTLNQLELYTDGARLQQLLFNLLINATKFTSQGSITLTLEIESGGDNALFSVEDTGCGISSEKQKKIFNRFEKLNENIQGSGLGLAICQLITERFGGKIWIDPTYKEGSRFFFAHPLVTNKEEEVYS